jgi:hypothetical protein
MGGQQVGGQRPDLVEVEFGGGMRVQHGGVIDVLGVLGQQRLHGQVLHVDVGPHQRDQLRRDVVHDGRLQPMWSTSTGTSTAQPAGSCGDEPRLPMLP